MFPFDQAALPQLTTRRALIAVDFQNDFTSTDGALPVTEPEGYVDRAITLASALRRTGGDVVWIKSRFDASRPVTGDKIITSDSPSELEPAPEATPAPSPRTTHGRGVPAALKAITAARRRDRAAASAASASASADPAVEPAGQPDSEAFLSKDEPICLKDSSSPASDWTLKVKDAMEKKDMSLTKTHYSAFNGTRLVYLLRANMIMEVFICGSLTNVGVYATAMDAAGHGLSITIVEDCCGYRTEARQRRAIESLVDYTGCEVASMEEVLEMIMPDEGRDKAQDKVDHDSKDKTETGNSRVSNSPDIVNPMTGLRLKSKSMSPLGASAGTNAPGQADSQAKPKLRETIGSDRTSADLTSIEGDTEDKEAGRTGQLAPDDQVQSAERDPEAASSPTKIFEMDQHYHASDSDSDPPAQQNLCEGDTDIIQNVLPPELEDAIFDKLRDEIRWQRMSHQGGEVPRLVAVQGEVASDGSMPVYRHPSDESPPLLPFSPTVLEIKSATEKHLGHPLNHALIQYYRDGKDYISEHSDKTLDIVKDSYIANVSLGAERTMVLRTKRQDKDPSLAQPSSETTEGPKRQTQRARLPHNSLCRMGLKTNMKWLHAIRQDKRAERDKTPAELAFAGGRISLTFRHIGTFLDKDESIIWGQGATSKTREGAKAVINGTGPEAIEMLKAFGTENHSSTFDWDARYGQGFDVLHMSSSPRFFASSDGVVNLRIALMLAELGVEWAKGSMGPALADVADSEDVPIKFIDVQDGKATVNGELAIMLYLDATYGRASEYQRKWSGYSLAKLFTRFQEALTWAKNIQRVQRASEDEKTELLAVRKTLGPWNVAAAEAEKGEDGFLAGDTPSLVDVVVWPTLHSLVNKHGEGLFEEANAMKEYYAAFGARESTKKAVGRMPLVDNH